MLKWSDMCRPAACICVIQHITELPTRSAVARAEVCWFYALILPQGCPSQEGTPDSGRSNTVDRLLNRAGSAGVELKHTGARSTRALSRLRLGSTAAPAPRNDAGTSGQQKDSHHDRARLRLSGALWAACGV